MNVTTSTAPTGYAPKLFLSYRRADSAGIAGRISDRLTAYFGKEALFKDVDDIPIGANFEQVIASVIGQSAVALVLVGPTWATIANERGRRLDDPQDVVRLEVEAALRRGIPVIPVLTEGADAPDLATLPASLQPLFAHTPVQVRNNPWFDGDMSQLATTLSQWIPLRTMPTVQSIPANPGVPTAGIPGVPSKKRPTRRRQWFTRPLGIAAIAVLLLAVMLIGITGAGLAGIGPLGGIGVPLATAPIQPTATATPIEHVVLNAPLNQAQTGWETDSECAFQSDGYHVTAPAGDLAYCLIPDSYASFHLQARVHAAAIAAPVVFALVFHISDAESFDYFTASLGGDQLSWFVYSHNNGDVTYLGGDYATTINASGTDGTLLEVYAHGAAFSIRVNGTPLGSFQDTSNPAGQIGLGVEVGNTPAAAIYTSITLATLGS